jgi:hypothetical protein
MMVSKEAWSNITGAPLQLLSFSPSQSASTG